METKEPTQEASQALDSEQTQEAPVAAMPFDLSTIDPDKIKMAEDFGIPIGQIFNWAASVEERFRVMEKELPRAVALELQALGQKRQAQAQAQAQGQGQQGRSGSQIEGMIVKALSGGESDPWMVDMQKKMMDVNYQRMVKSLGYMDENQETERSFVKAIKDAMIKNITGKAVAEMVKP